MSFVETTNKETALTEKARRSIAIGAAAAVNCRPCLEFHVPLGSKAGLSQNEIRQAIEIGFGVNRGAQAKTRGYIDAVISDSESQSESVECSDEESAEQPGCC